MYDLKPNAWSPNSLALEHFRETNENVPSLRKRGRSRTRRILSTAVSLITIGASVALAAWSILR